MNKLIEQILTDTSARAEGGAAVLSEDIFTAWA
jgi:hypothetical protein